MTTMTSGRDLVALPSVPKVRLNWARIGFLSVNLVLWAGVIAAVRHFI